MKGNEKWSGMTRAHHTALARYIRELADELGLRDWSITLSDQPDEDDENLAATLCTNDSRQATVILGQSFATNSRSDQRATLVHELLHCHFAAQARFVIYSTRDVMGRPAASVLEHGFKSHSEYVIDAIAVAIGPRFPLPPKP